MFYYASKIGWFFATPSNLLASLVLVGLVLALLPRWRRVGLATAILATLALFVAGLSPLASLVMLPLEERFPIFEDDGRPVDGIILLGAPSRPAIPRRWAKSPSTRRRTGCWPLCASPCSTRMRAS